ncbi:MAG TPA: hypothetical protein PLL36_08745 [Candidatus Hydrogenedentes bacterium]|nr:hypothetical protein [Candidatus Hydrogenedentota bacterium]
MNTATVSTAQDLGAAIKDRKDEIIIEGDLQKRVIRIRATGKVAWIVAFGAIAVVVISVLPTIPTGGTSEVIAMPARIVAAPAAIGILGFGTTLTATTIAIAAGGIGALTTLRHGYKLKKRDGKVILIKKRP